MQMNTFNTNVLKKNISTSRIKYVERKLFRRKEAWHDTVSFYCKILWLNRPNARRCFKSNFEILCILPIDTIKISNRSLDCIEIASSREMLWKLEHLK